MIELGMHRTLAQLALPRAVEPGGPPPNESDSAPSPTPQPPPVPSPRPAPRPPAVPAPVPTPLPAPGPGMQQPTEVGFDPTTSWRPLGLPIDLPTIPHVLESGGEALWQWHPRDPNIRVSGRHRAPETRPEQPPQAGGPGVTDPTNDPGAAQDSDERSGVAKGAMIAGIGGGFVMNAIDVARLVKKYPEALRAGQHVPELGRLGRLPAALSLTAQMRVDSTIVDPALRGMGPASAATLGKSFDKFDSVMMRSSVLLGASLAAIQIGSAIPNLMDAVAKEGPWHENLLQSTSGRFGMLQLGGGLLGSALFATALRQTAGQAGEGVVARIMAAGNAPIMAKPMWGRIGIGTGLLVAANEFGYLDMFNTGETRSTGTVLRDAARSTPIVNDSTLRTGLMLTAGGIIGFKAHRAMTTAGAGISGMPKGYWAAGAVAAGLIGAQLLGGLSGIDKPSD